ncbi:aromatic amino acid ammonia-lyase [Nocardia arthritidis]|uniref:Aromatic amino acid lyase n=1 Tax=Nocardia arthritidis TaxID=228602 RepID=A0A6G9YEH8_9NOCA|nr:aromatic amino acid ammonia-lyase [Nocardia arthritidis]QIS11530.1 aromatic amino acid lyase [Nocardia arthritidis]
MTRNPEPRRTAPFTSKRCTVNDTGPLVMVKNVAPDELEVGADNLTIGETVCLARNPRQRRAGLHEGAIARMRNSVALKHRLIADRQPIYGVTTGFGDSCIRQISPDKVIELQRNLVRYHLNGSGPDAAAEVVRATMLIRANCLARGYSSVRPEVVRLLLDCLNADVLPVIPERGSVGASGDLVPLCYLANMLTGAGEVRFRGTLWPAERALAEAGLRPIVLQAKEALALINGTSFMSGFAVLAAADATELAAAADVCTALAVEALLGNRGHFEAVIHTQKPHPGQLRSAARIRALLAGSQLCRDQPQVLAENPELGDQGYVQLTHPIQDRYSIRCAPHVTGVLLDTLDWVRPWLHTEINSTNDNPLFDVDTQSVYNGGNFYGGHVGQAMDSLKVAVASVGDLLDRQLALIVDEKFNRGLTPNLIPRFADDDYQAGLHHGFKGMQLACSALTAEALKLAAPATVFSRSTEAHNQDKVSMGTIAARDARTIVELVQNITAIHLAALCQAVELRGHERLGRGTLAAFRAVRKRVAFLDADRRSDTDIAALVELIRSGELRRVSIEEV